VAQHLQMLTFSSYAKKNNISIKFYGNELVGFESRHDLFKEYLNKGQIRAFIFFSIRQFYIEGEGLDKKLISKAIDQSVTLHFSNEDLKISKISEIIDIELLMFNKRNKL
jgi:hypothetical protein